MLILQSAALTPSLQLPNKLRYCSINVNRHEKNNFHASQAALWLVRWGPWIGMTHTHAHVVQGCARKCTLPLFADCALWHNTQMCCERDSCIFPGRSFFVCCFHGRLSKIRMYMCCCMPFFSTSFLPSLRPYGSMRMIPWEINDPRRGTKGIFF